MKNPYFQFIEQNSNSYSGTKVYYATADVIKTEIKGDGIEYRFEDKPSRAQKIPEINSVWFARMKATYKFIYFTDINSEYSSNLILSSGFAGFRALKKEYFPFLYGSINNKNFHLQKDSLSSGATQISITNDGLARITTIVPDEEIINKFSQLVISMIEQVLILRARNQTLRKTRDLLLPRLISGRLDVKDLDIEV